MITVTHASPELIFNHGYGSQTDIWSVGCLLYEMITTLQAYPL
jgi:serine/threonine protein kinase